MWQKTLHNLKLQYSDTNFKNPTAVGIMFDACVGKGLAVKFSVQHYKSRSSERLRSKSI